ncbi:Condensation domain-containing protein [Amycolatopsis pretoriensis]|uniref:Condensation domain-containing protein n=1 Tax=Amycolatopsis pretoriensis TaxID=218821 RepID=A0A1H5QE65_9PSEU|nr:condensation domain-containing protein [Amycolatopsis pretoriensis]SEF24144.1 Condensation domain-containing protein [Amycolatopsis pretoriensis]
MPGEAIWPASNFQRWVMAAARDRPWLAGPWFTMNAEVLLSGPVDRRVLGTALAELLRRHEVLRTRVVDDDAGPLQVVSGKAVAVVEDTDGDESLHVPVDSASPLVVRVARRGPREHVLFLHLHHMIADPETVWGVLTELGALYSAYSGGGAPPAAPGAQYGQYAAFEEDRRRSGRQAARQWWADTVGDHGFVRAHGGRAPYAYRDVLLEPDELATAHRLAKTHRATILTTLFAALACAVRPRFGAGRVMFTTVFGQRDRPEWRRVLGPCIVPAFVPLPAPPERLDAEYARAVRDTVLGCRRHCRPEPHSGAVPAGPVPFFEYVPDRWPTAVRFGAATGRVVNAAGPKDFGGARGFAVRARVDHRGALTAHVSGDVWSDVVAREVLGGLAAQIRRRVTEVDFRRLTTR